MLSKKATAPAPYSEPISVQHSLLHLSLLKFLTVLKPAKMIEFRLGHPNPRLTLMTWQIHYQEAEKNILATHAEYNNAYNGSKLNDISNGILIVISYSFHSFIPINSLDVKRHGMETW